MCYKIEASFMLIHFLKTRENCTIYELVEKKFLIEKEMPSVFIDVARSSILSYIAYYPEIFEINDDKISKKESASLYFNEPLINYFDLGIERSLKSRITVLLNE